MSEPGATLTVAAAPVVHVAPGPHLSASGISTQRMMVDVLLGLSPVVAWAIWMFRWGAVVQLALGVFGCMVAEFLFTAMRRRRPTLCDGSAAVTGVILALSLPSTAPWYVGVIAAFSAIGLGKVVFGGLGANLFNPAMVGRAFVMIAFPVALGSAAYILPEGHVIHGVSSATPLTAMRQMGEATPLLSLFLGTNGGSMGETSDLACLLGGLYLVWRRAAAWQIPVGMIGAVLVIGGLGNLLHPASSWTVAHELFAGSMMFAAFFIATDPVSSPLTPRGRLIFGAGTGALVLLIRRLSGYPEGVTFAVLLMNAVVPLINRWTIPLPVGGLGPKSVKPS